MTILTIEKDIEESFCEVIKEAGGLAIKFQDSTRRGAPDRLVFDKLVRKPYFVEFKKPGGRLAPLQIAYAKMLDGHADVYLIDSMERLGDFLYARMSSQSFEPFRLLNQ